MDPTRKKWAAKRALLHAIHNHEMPNIMRCHLRVRVIQYDLLNRGYTLVGQITAMFKDHHDWSVEFVQFMWYMFNMAYFGCINEDTYITICRVCTELEMKYGTEWRDYFVHGNSEYSPGNLVSLKHGVMSVFAKYDIHAYFRLQDGIEGFDELHRVLCAYDPDEHGEFYV